LFGWVWIIASLAFAYFLIAAIFFHSPWSRVGWAFGAGAGAKWLARGFNDHKAPKPPRRNADHFDAQRGRAIFGSLQPDTFY
jgi:hypothetical protein